MPVLYKDQLKDPRWQKKRLKILERDNWACRLCGDTETTLNVHHKEYCGLPWEVEDDLLITYCEHCHYIVEDFGNRNGDNILFLDRVIKLKDNSINDLLDIIACYKFKEEFKKKYDEDELYIFYQVYLKTREISYQYTFNKSLLNELTQKLNG